MKKRTLGCLIISFLVMVALLQVPAGPAYAKEKDTNPPAVKTDTIKVDKNTVDLNDTVTISMKIDDESEIASAVLWIVADGELSDSGVGIYNTETGLWDFKVEPRYFGLNEIEHISLTDVYSNYAEYFNASSARVPDYYTAPYDSYVDLGGGNFNVSNGTYTKETNAPVIELNSLTVSDQKPEINDTVYFKVKINDSSPVASTYFDYAYSSACLRTYGKYDPESGYYLYDVRCSNYGEYEPLRLAAEDAFGNLVTYIDRDQSYTDKYSYGTVSGNDADLSAANFTVQGGKGDITPPTLDVSSFKVEKIYLDRTENTIISFKAQDDTGIDTYNTDIWYAGLRDSVAAGCRYNKNTGRYEVLVSGDCYGTHQIYEIKLCDKYGNMVYYLDEGSDIGNIYGYKPEQGYIDVDMSLATFYVGIENKETGTFVSNSTMDDTTKLKVEELDENGEAYKELAQSGNNVKAFYDVDVKGACEMTSEKTKVFFDAPEGFSDGDKLKISHMLANGTVQTENAVVESGKVCMDVDEFSPFMITVKKSKDKNLFTKNGMTYQVTGKKTVTFIKPSKKTVTKLAIPATVKANGKTYNVTKINADACKNCKKLKTVTIGKNVSRIGKNAFYNCKKVKTLTIKTTSLTSTKVGKNAFKGVPAKAKLKLPSKKAKAYKKLLKSRGLGK